MLDQMTLPKKYSKLSPTERRLVRIEYVRRQKGKCWYCKEDLDKEPPKFIKDKRITPYLYPKGFFDSPIHLQHDHKTDYTEGAVHAYCNAVL
jgi:hypothetical protein